MSDLREAAQLAVDAASLCTVAERVGMTDQDLLDYLAGTADMLPQGDRSGLTSEPE